MTPYTVHILECSDGSCYTGHTQDLDDRLQAHNNGEAAKCTYSRRPVALAYSETTKTESDAIRRERQIKRRTRAKKEALIAGNNDRLRRLSKRQS